MKVSLICLTILSLVGCTNAPPNSIIAKTEQVTITVTRLHPPKHMRVYGVIGEQEQDMLVFSKKYCNSTIKVGDNVQGTVVYYINGRARVKLDDNTICK